MPQPDESAYRSHYRATGDEVQVREGDEIEDDDGVIEIRMPIATTGEVRNDGDDPLTRDELNGMARQLKDRQIGVFPAHGNDDMIAFGRYSPFERLGDWTDAAIESREDENVLLATARMPDPEELPAATGDYREALAILKEQAKRGIAQDASIGWRDDDDFPGGVDLMEASIVGIGADWRTNTGDEAAEVVARAAVESGADADALLEKVRAAVESQDADADTDTTQDNDMSDPDPDDEPTDEQDTDADATSAPGDIDEADIAEFVSETYDGVDGSDVADALANTGGEFTGLTEDTVGWFFADVLDVTASEVMDMMDGEDGEDTDEENGDDMDDEDEDEEEQDATPDDEQDATPDDEQDADASDLRQEVESLREELTELREGGLNPDDVDTPDTDDEQDADTDESDESDTDTRDSEGGDGFDNLGDYT